MRYFAPHLKNFIHTYMKLSIIQQGFVKLKDFWGIKNIEDKNFLKKEVT